MKSAAGTKIIAGVMLLVLILTLSACGPKSGKKDVSMFDLQKAMIAAADFKEMNYVSSSDDGAGDLFTYLSDMDYSKVEQFFLSYAKDGKGNADEVAVVRVKTKADLDEAVKSLENHLQKRIQLYRTYDPTQSEKIEKGIVFSQDDLAILIVSDDNAAVKSACIEYLNAN